MKKKISFSTPGQRADIANITIYRMLPNRSADRVGSFVFLDHVAPALHSTAHNGTTGAHPHRGIATLSYIIHGEIEHFDSTGNRQKVHSGGIQWMKAGNGIIHDEILNYDSKTGSKLTHGFQFWINLPSRIKAEKPAYLAIEGNDVPKKILPGQSGWLKIIVGNYEGMKSVIPDYLTQFLYHIHLEAGKQLSIEMEEGIEIAALLPTHNATINDGGFHAGELVEFDREAGSVELQNTADEAIDILLFGGEPYTEPVIAEGPFVMNTVLEIEDAYNDYHAGKYGKIDYKRSGK